MKKLVILSAACGVGKSTIKGLYAFKFAYEPFGIFLNFYTVFERLLA